MTFLMRFPEDVDPDELYYITQAKYEQIRSKFNMNNNVFFHSSLNTLKNKLGFMKALLLRLLLLHLVHRHRHHHRRRRRLLRVAPTL